MYEGLRQAVPRADGAAEIARPTPHAYHPKASVTTGRRILNACTV
jgi:hypothetical protein